MEQYLLRLLIAAVLGLVMGIISNTQDNTRSSRVFCFICTGAALTSITAVGIYGSMNIPYVGDPGRLPAQVISALGFLGTGMILVTEDNKVRGMSTAASLWLTAILGMLIGAGTSSVWIIGAIFFILIYTISPFIPVRRQDRNQ